MTEKPERMSPDAGKADASDEQPDARGHPTGEKQAAINREDDPPA
jgi:hypothetical protein